MGSSNEKRMNKLLNFPIGSYLMLRLDYVLICQDELEAKILRLIEMYMESERDRLYREHLNTLPKGTEPDQIIEITKDVWVAISHRTFMYDLYKLVKSENTLKRAISSLAKKGFIRTRYAPSKRYEAPEYQLNTENIQIEFDKLAQHGIAGYQKLIPSKIDTINDEPPQKLTPSEGQSLIPSSPSRVSEVDTNSRSNYEKNITVENNESVYGTYASVMPASAEHDAHTLAQSENETQSQQATVSPIQEQPSYSHDIAQTNEEKKEGIASPPSNASSSGAVPAIGSTQEKPLELLPPEPPAPKRKSAKPKAEKPPVTYLCDKAELQAKINEWRGFALDDELSIIRERKAINILAQKYTIEQCKYVRDYIRRNDDYWSKPANRDRIGATAIIQKAAEVVAKVKKQTNGGGTVAAPTSTPIASPATEAGYTDYTPKAGETFKPLKRLSTERKRA